MASAGRLLVPRRHDHPRGRPNLHEGRRNTGQDLHGRSRAERRYRDRRRALQGQGKEQVRRGRGLHQFELQS